MRPWLIAIGILVLVCSPLEVHYWTDSFSAEGTGLYVYGLMFAIGAAFLIVGGLLSAPRSPGNPTTPPRPS